MTIKKLILGSLVVATFAGAALPAAARTDVDLYVTIGPPPPARYEIVPAPRVGFTWVSGYWDVRAHRHYWVAGHWVKSRRGYAYHTARWYEHDGRWYVVRGGWHPYADNDHDGVPNYLDRAPNNPYRF